MEGMNVETPMGGIGGGVGGVEWPTTACGLGELDAIGGPDAGAAGATGGMILEIGGEYFDLGPGTGDVDADGIADSVTLADDRGLSIYADVDGDGTVDHVTTVLFDGTYETWTASSATSAASAGADGSSGATPSGVNPDGIDKRETPATWGVHEWERGELGRWA